MSITRRLFLRGIPIAGAAARGIAQEVTTQLAGTALPEGMGIGVLGTFKARTPVSGDYDGGEDDEKEKSRLRILADWVRTHGIPEWKRRQIREGVQANRVIDPDIAVLRSVSITNKLRMQWDRDEKQVLARELRYLNPDNHRRSWLKKLGIDYW